MPPVAKLPDFLAVGRIQAMHRPVVRREPDAARRRHGGRGHEVRGEAGTGRRGRSGVYGVAPAGFHCQRIFRLLAHGGGAGGAPLRVAAISRPVGVGQRPAAPAPPCRARSGGFCQVGAECGRMAPAEVSTR